MSNVIRMRKFSGFICMAPIYDYQGYFFEFKPYLGPLVLNKDGEPSKRQPSVKSKFWDVFEQFVKLSDKEQVKFKIDGGCIPI